MSQKSTVSPEQEAVSVLRSGSNVFITGGAGSGKTFISQNALNALEAEGFQVIRAAPTGIAADGIGGITLHRLLGLSGPLILHDEAGKAFLQKASGNRLSKVDIVFVDEVSMVSRPLFDILAHEIGSEHSKGHTVLLVVCGDFLQLPPVIPPEEAHMYADLYQSNTGHGFAFESEYWESFNFHPIILEKSFRQEDDRFCSVLDRIRIGDKNALSLVRDFTSSAPVPDAIWICGRKDDARTRNNVGLQQLEGEPVLYHAISQGNIPETGLPAPQLLTVKPHMPIIMTANDPCGHYVNGSMGYVIKAETDRIYVSLKGTRGRIAVCRRTWKSQNDTDNWEFSQFPMDAAFALTVHRAQGMTLEKVNISPYCWESGQLYVMLSRIRDPKQMYLAAELKEEYLVANSAAVSWYRSLNEIIPGLALVFPEFPVAGFEKIPCNLYRQGLRFGVYTFRFALNGQPVTRSYVALRDEKKRWIAVTDFSRYCTPVESVRPVTSDVGDRLYFITLFLNYAFVDTHSINTLDEITPEIVQTFLSAYATGIYGIGKRTAETISRCTNTIVQFLLALLEDRGSQMLLTRNDLFRKKCFFSSRKMIETREVLAFSVQYDAEAHILLRDMPVKAVQYLLSYIWKNDPNILLAVALQLFAGLRPAEPLSISENELHIRWCSGQMMSVKIDLTKERILREDGVMTDGIKKPRIAEVYPAYLSAFADCWERWNAVRKNRGDAAPLCLDNNGNAMTYQTYYRRFKKAIENIIPLLHADPDPEIREYAILLESEGAAPHILRHVFTVTLVLAGLSEAEIMNARGDTSPQSALAYLSRKSELLKRFSETVNVVAEKMLEACRNYMEVRK